MAEVVNLDRFRTGKGYTVWQAARLAGVTPQTAKRWLLGYDRTYESVGPVFGDRARPTAPSQSALMLSFLELVELVIVGKFRKKTPPLKLERIRAAHKFAREQWDLPYPFASLNLLQFGGHLLHVFDQKYPAAPPEAMALDMGGQPTLPGFVRTELEQNIDFPDVLAGRWYPYGREAGIVVDPRVAAGRPSIDQTGVTVATAHARWREGGESIASLARDYGISRDILEKALQAADRAA